MAPKLQIRNAYGIHARFGLCRPAGDQPYFYIFTVHALSVAWLDIPDDASSGLAASCDCEPTGEGQVHNDSRALPKKVSCPRLIDKRFKQLSV